MNLYRCLVAPGAGGLYQWACSIWCVCDTLAALLYIPHVYTELTSPLSLTHTTQKSLNKNQVVDQRAGLPPLRLHGAHRPGLDGLLLPLHRRRHALVRALLHHTLQNTYTHTFPPPHTKPIKQTLTPQPHHPLTTDSIQVEDAVLPQGLSGHGHARADGHADGGRSSLVPPHARHHRWVI